MCGIAGFINRRGQAADVEVLRRMVAVLRHRGPDDEGFYANAGIGLAHRRLKIIDLTAGGHQPMTDNNGCYLVFNGEIYNYQELNKKYGRGIKWQSSSDTEVLLHCLKQKGADILPELKGMFALAFWDGTKRQLLLARDAFGKKPLYFADLPEVFVFASEIKSLLKHPAVTIALDKTAAVKYFWYEYVPEPATGYLNIKQLSPGSLATADDKRVVIKKWWRPPFGSGQYDGIAEEQAIKLIDEKMRQAVQRRLVADVPVGLLLSGGIDSTTIAWYMRELQPGTIHSFSVSFPRKTFDETAYARRAAGALGTEHHDIQFGLQEFNKAMEKISSAMDVPFGDSSLLPTFTVCQAARRFITVALDGDGSDELLGGYGNFRAAAAASLIPNLSPKIWRFLQQAVNKWPTSYDYFSFDFKLKSFLKGLGYRLPIRNQIWLGSFTPAELNDVLTLEFKQWLPHIDEDLISLEATVARCDEFNAVSALTAAHYLTNDILVKLDRASMLTSVEARTPFLDVDLAEFIIQLPVRFKRNKYLLKRLMRGRIPDEIIDRPKQGFALPLGSWLKGSLFGWACSVLSRDKIRSGGVLEPLAVEQILAEHKSGHADHRKKIWTMLMFQIWYEKWISNQK